MIMKGVITEYHDGVESATAWLMSIKVGGLAIFAVTRVLPMPSTLQTAGIFLSDGIENPVEEYNSSRVGVVCRVPKFKRGIISKRFELEG